MATRSQFRLFKTLLLIFVTLAAQQVVLSAEPDSESPDGDPAPVIEFQDLSASGHYSDALALAARVVDQGDDFGAETRALLVEPLMKLALIEKQSGKNLHAERAGELAIELIERNGGVFDPALIEPLVFLAQLEQDNGDHPAALERLNRAQHISHRADGVMGLEQLPILAEMTKSYAAMNQRIMANMMIAQSYAIKMRKLDQDSIEVIPILLEQAEIRAMRGHYRTARELVYFSLGILEQSLMENDPGFVEALSILASVRYREQLYGVPNLNQERLQAGDLPLPFPPIRSPYLGRKEGTVTLRRMITIMDEHSDRFPAIERAETYIRLGDWFMITRKPRLAHDAYRSAWQILADEDNATKLLASYFGQPKRLKYFRPRLPQFGPGRYENYDNKYAEVRYSVNEKGVVRNLKIVDSNSPAVMNGNMRSAVRGAIFRPRYVDGQPVVTDDLFLREEFAGTTLPVGAIPADN